jgi:uncharacterized cupredoxin-like copper-binding protein
MKLMKCFGMFLLGSVVWAHWLVRPVLGADRPGLHDHSILAGAGLKKELLAGLGEADFMKLGDKPKSVKITLIAAWNETNFWMNLNGYSHGRAAFAVPTGWTVEVVFINPSPSPHSSIVVEREMVRKVQVGVPAFEGASTENPITGISAGKATFSFTASASGQYAFSCGVPNHAMAGHWVALEVSDDLKVPTVALGDAPAREAR